MALIFTDSVDRYNKASDVVAVYNGVFLTVGEKRLLGMALVSPTWVKHEGLDEDMQSLLRKRWFKHSIARHCWERTPTGDYMIDVVEGKDILIPYHFRKTYQVKIGYQEP